MLSTNYPDFIKKLRSLNSLTRCLTIVKALFLHPLPEVQCPNFLDIHNPWGKIMERNSLRFAAAKKKVFQDSFHLLTPFKRLFAPTSRSPNILDFWNPWGKVMERSCLRFENFCS